ncbi:hypothetical protein DL98DRAFT_584337 [Cadophora sp. DSE1049]|nr:hypothetical protein DL98DRAFT_584337 [Cadophora sp. DSE1049]
MKMTSVPKWSWDQFSWPSCGDPSPLSFCRIVCFNERAVALVKALRGGPKLHHEVLEVFYSKYTCSISVKNREAGMVLPRLVIKRLISLQLWYGPQFEDTQWKWCIRSLISIGVSPMSHVRSLYVSTKSPGLSTHRDCLPSTSNLSQLADIIRKCVLVLQCLPSLTLEIPRDVARIRRIAAKPVQCLEIPIQPISKALVMMHRWMTCERKFVQKVGVVWDADRYGTLARTDRKYWKVYHWPI